MSKLKSASSVFMSIVLAAGVCPASALAAQPEGDTSAVVAVGEPQYSAAQQRASGQVALSAGNTQVSAPDAEAAGGEASSDGRTPDPNEIVTVVVELESGQTHGGFMGLFAQGGADHQSFRDQIAKLVADKAKQSDSAGGLSVQSVPDIGDGRDYYNVIDGFTVQVPRGVIDEIRSLDGVAAAFESQLHPAAEDMGQQDAPLNANSLGMTGADSVSYTGKGQAIAIVDTGLRTDHKSFSGELDDSSLTLTEEKVGQAKSTMTSGGADGVYLSEKIPFAYDYAMHDSDVTDGHGHGTHVAGIAGANAGDVRGTAPDAQLVIMKVANDQGGILDDAILAALDDAAKLDLAAVNISIGADGGFSGDAQDTFANAVTTLESTGKVVNVSAGNSYSSAQSNLSGKNLPYASDPDSGTISSPASAPQATAVASANNELGRSYFTTTAGDQVFWQYGLRQSDNSKWKTLDELADGEWEIFDGQDGKNWIQYMDGFDSSKNQIVLIERGGESWAGDIMTFDYKLYRSEGAKAIIVYDNVESSTPPSAMMDGSYTSWAPRDEVAFATVTRADGLKLLELAKNGGKIVLKSGQATEPSADYAVNDFSSWGSTPDLSLKPDITAPGGNIYSTTNDGAYGYMSGTSMAAPQMTGIAAQVRQYVNTDAKFSGMSVEQKNDAVTQLLMSTAKPLVDSATANGYYSPRQQGSGIANVPAAVSTNVYATVDDAADAAHPKAELGESEAGSWAFTVTLHNLGSEAASFDLDAAALSDQIADGLFQQHSVNYAGNGIDVSFGGAAADGAVTVPANGTASFTVSIACQASFKAAVAEAVNGTFVEGFVFMSSTDGGVDLSVPFMGFYGDWSKAPIFDGKLMTDDARLWGNYLSTEGIGNFGGPLGYNPLADDSVWGYANTVNNRDSWAKDYYPDRLVVSNSADSRAPHSVTTNTYLLRGAYEFQWGFSKAGAEEGIQAYYRAFLKKSQPDREGRGREPILSAETVANGYAQFTFNGLDEGDYEVTEDAIVAGDSNATPQQIKYDIYYDKTKPVASDVVNTEGDDATVSFTVTDKSWLAGVTVQENPVYVVSSTESIKSYLDTDLNVQESVNADGERVYRVSIPIADLKAAWLANGYRDEANMPNTLSLIAWDWGMNPTDPITAVLIPEPATGISLSAEHLDVVPGQHKTLEPTLAPANTTDTIVDWESSNEDVATVDEHGVVTGVAPGNATITATVHGRSVSTQSEVVVKDITQRQAIALSDDIVRVRNLTGEAVIDALLEPGLSGKVVNWTSSNEDVFTVLPDAENPNSATICGGYQVGVAEVAATVLDNDGNIRTARAQIRNWPDDYEDFVIDENGTLTAYKGASLTVEIPNDVKAIGESVFGSKRATEYRIPASVQTIGKEAFLDTPAGTVVFEDTEEHPSHLVEIGERAFANDEAGQIGWDSIRFPESLTTLGEGVMQGKSCGNIYVPASVTVIPNHAFDGSHSAVWIGDDVTYIGDYAFSNGGPQAMMFEALFIIGKEETQEDSLLPSKVTYIGDHAFQGTNIFTEVTMPETLKHVGESAFNAASQSIHNNGGPALKVNLNEGLESIGAHAFEGTRVEQIVIPDSVTEVGEGAFSSCAILMDVTVGKNVGEGDLVGAFVYDESLERFIVSDDCVNYTVDDQNILYNNDMTEVVSFPMGVGGDYVVPEGVTVIKSGAFDSYDGAFLNFREVYPDSITFPETLQTIEPHALNTYLNVVELGANVKNVSVDAFRDRYNDDLNPASPAHLIVRGGQDYEVGYTNNVDYYHTSYFGPGAKVIDFDGEGFRTSDIMVVASETLDEFKFNTNWWPEWHQDPVQMWAKKGTQAYDTIRKAIEDAGIDFGYWYDGWCIDQDDNMANYDGARKPILREYTDLAASIESDSNIVAGRTVKLNAAVSGGVDGDKEVRWLQKTADAQRGLSAQAVTGQLSDEVKVLKDWSTETEFEWTVPEDGSVIFAEVRDATFFTVQAYLAEQPVFKTQPESQKALQGKDVKLSAEAQSTDGGAITYQWYRATKADLTDVAVIPGATDAELSVPTEELGTVYYTVVARNTLDNGQYADARSAAATVEVVDVDKTALEEAIAAAKAVEQGKKTDKAYEALQDAIADAAAVSADERATQTEVEAAVDDLEAAVKAFQESADKTDKTALDASIAAAKAVEQGKKADDAYKALQDVIVSAASVSADENATQEQADAATAALEAAVKAFQESADKADKTALDAAKAEAMAIEQGKKTDDAFKALQDAIADAAAVAADGHATQAEVDAAVEALTQAVKAFQESPDTVEPIEVKSVMMFRLYNPYSGEHFFTADAKERDHLDEIGWNYESVAWKAPEKSDVPVYRLYNPFAGEHHYTISASERDNLVKLGWNDEGIGWYSDADEHTPLMRVYNPNARANNHHFTADVEERDGLVKLGWNDEGIGWYGL